MSSEDIAYYRQRAATERSRVSDAPSFEIAGVHAKLAQLYEDLIARLEQSQPGHQDLRSVPHIAAPTRLDTRI